MKLACVFLLELSDSFWVNSSSSSSSSCFKHPYLKRRTRTLPSYSLCPLCLYGSNFSAMYFKVVLFFQYKTLDDLAKRCKIV